LAARNLTANGTNSSSCGFCFTSYKDWQRLDEKFGIDYIRLGEIFYIDIFHYSIGKAVMNAPRLGTFGFRKECFTGIG
jgi:hypothetical protein